MRHRRREQRRRNRQVIDPIAIEPALVLDDVETGAERRETGLAVEIRRAEEQAGGEGLPRLCVDRPPRELLHAVSRKGAVLVVGRRLAADSDDSDARRQQAVDVQVVERRQQLAMRKVARAAEDDDRHFAFFTAWPPNWLRSAASIRSPNGLFWRDRKRV